MDAPSVPLDASGCIAQDLSCKRCGYNIRGLRIDGVCPECATPIGRSVSGDLLRFADPKWVAKVATGLNIIVVGMVLGILVGCFAGGAAAALGGAGAVNIVSAILNVTMTIVALVGTWMMTEPDPSGLGEDGNVNARKVVRATMVANVTATVLVQLMAVVPGIPAASMLILLLSLAASLISLVGEWFKYVFYERLALRIPDAKIAGRARFLRWGYAVLFGIAGVGGAAFALITGGAPVAAGAAVAPFIVVAGIAGLIVIVLSVLTLGMILRLRKLLLEQADLARRTWAAALPTARVAT